MKRYKQLTSEQRYQISGLLKAGLNPPTNKDRSMNSKSTPWSAYFIPLIWGSLLLFPLTLRADESATLLLQKRVAALESKLNAVELRLQRIEGNLPAVQTSPMTQSPHAMSETQKPMRISTDQLKANWGMLSRDLSEDAVLKLLGEPNRRVDMGTQMMWLYGYLGTGTGSVIFSNNKSLISWQKPAF